MENNCRNCANLRIVNLEDPDPKVNFSKEGLKEVYFCDYLNEVLDYIHENCPGFEPK